MNCISGTKFHIFLCDFCFSVTCFLMFEKNVELFDWKRYIIAFDDIE